MTNRAFFAIRYGLDGDVWMNQFGDLGSRTRCRVFETADEAQTFLDGRRLRRGFRPRLSVQPLSADDIRDMANDAAECLACAKRHGASQQDVLEWTAIFNRLVDMTPLGAGA